ncbi:MAG: hypothetical protein M1837_005916 [Sclerophora amabilis]|nr:MAG: hypothetical protein M1837_005916 [Sclerophora amabilis]
MRINIPPLTRALLVVLVSLSLTTAVIRYRQWTTGPERVILVPYLTIVPSASLIYPWVLFTATLVEQNVFTLIITAGTIFYGGRYLERAWSSVEFAKFLLVTMLIPNVLAFATYVVWFAVSGNPVRLYTAICGGVALQAGFLVAFKQLVPEHLVTILKGIIKIRVKHFPAIFLLLNILSGFILGTDTGAILAIIGFLSSWTYLRFFKISFPDLTTDQPTSLRGDASETFAFAYFFPEPIHGPIAAAADAIYNVLVTIKICTPFSSADVDAGNSQAAARGEGGLPGLLSRGASGGPAPGSARAEAERRRALALRALDQRLHAATGRPENVRQNSQPTGTSTQGEPPQEEGGGRESQEDQV